MRLSASLCFLVPALLICLELHQANCAPQNVRMKRTLGLIRRILNPDRCGGSCCGGSCSRANYNSAASNLDVTGPLGLFNFELGGSLTNAESAAHGGGGGFSGSGSSSAANANSFGANSFGDGGGGGGGGRGFSNSQASSNAASQSHGFGSGGSSAAQASSQAQSGAHTNFHNQGFGGAFFPQPIRPYHPNHRFNHNQNGCNYGAYGGCGFGPRRFNHGGGFGGV